MFEKSDTGQNLSNLKLLEGSPSYTPDPSPSIHLSNRAEADSQEAAACWDTRVAVASR